MRITLIIAMKMQLFISIWGAHGTVCFDHKFQLVCVSWFAVQSSPARAFVTADSRNHRTIVFVQSTFSRYNPPLQTADVMSFGHCSSQD